MSGYALLETLVASAIIVALAAGVAQVASLTSAAVRDSAAEGVAIYLAAQKLEQLAALAWTDTRTNLAFDPPTRDGRGLQPSGPITGAAANAGYIEYLDRDGRWVGTGAAPAGGASFVRRWSVRPHPARPTDVLVLQVAVAAAAVRGPAAPDALQPGDPGVTWIVTARARR